MKPSQLTILLTTASICIGQHFQQKNELGSFHLGKSCHRLSITPILRRPLVQPPKSKLLSKRRTKNKEHHTRPTTTNRQHSLHTTLTLNCTHNTTPPATTTSFVFCNCSVRFFQQALINLAQQEENIWKQVIISNIYPKQ